MGVSGASYVHFTSSAHSFAPCVALPMYPAQKSSSFGATRWGGV